MLNRQVSFNAPRQPITIPVSGLARSAFHWLSRLWTRREAHSFLILERPADYEHRRARFLGKSL